LRAEEALRKRIEKGPEDWARGKGGEGRRNLRGAVLCFFGRATWRERKRKGKGGRRKEEIERR